MEHLLAQTLLGGINVQFAMLCHMAVMLYPLLKRAMMDNVVCYIYFSCTTASDGDEMKAKLYQ